MTEPTPDQTEATESTVDIDDPNAAAADDDEGADSLAGEDVDDDELDDDEDEDQAGEDTADA